jgi:hypothetical protein
VRFLLALWCFIPAVAGAYDSQRAQTNLASDYATCAAFYMVTTQVLTDNSKDSSNAQAAARNSLDMAVTLSNREVTSARVEMVTQMMMEEMNDDWSNWAVVVNKYGSTCREITENPVQRLEYWLKKE